MQQPPPERGRARDELNESRPKLRRGQTAVRHVQREYKNLWFKASMEDYELK
jgi:hypothetical protein